jgi:hypothetical protein
VLSEINKNGQVSKGNYAPSKINCKYRCGFDLGKGMFQVTTKEVNTHIQKNPRTGQK